MHRSPAIANDFLRLAGEGGLTQMQLQKLTYFAHGWSLALKGEPLVGEDVEAWNYGPVYRELYDHTKYFGKAPIERLITPDDDEAVRFFSHSKSRPSKPYKAELTPWERQLIGAIWMRYGKLTGSRLSALTHQRGTPWFETYKSGRSEVIDNSLIKAHYDELAVKAKVSKAAGA